MASTELTLRVANCIGDIAADAWDACANPGFGACGSRSHDPGSCVTNGQGSRLGTGYNPFISHDFLSCLELSDSVRGRVGWQPMHLLATADQGMLLGAVPCYVKSHSRGEYVFDHGWAEAYERAGGSYYPKLQVSVPFTPATGRRLLVRPGTPAQAVRAALADALIDICGRCEASSVHVTYPTEEEWDLLGARGYLKRTHQQFHWENAGYDSFDAFLAALSSRKRKTIRREREEALAADISVHWLSGSDLTESVWDAFFEFYMETGSRKWGRPYLTRSFYSLVGEKMRNRILLVMAKRGKRWIAGAINFIGSDTLFGRHWGAIEHHPFLHFELCYYQAIQYAIEHRLARVEAGAQGEHKISRGYRPTTTYSAHYIIDPALRRAIDDFLGRERAYVAAAGDELAQVAPFRKG
jgi:predicted N-acyltransferase